MKIIAFFFLTIFLVACNPSAAATPTSAGTPTRVPTATSSVTRDGTPMPEVSEILSAANIKKISELARWGIGWLESKKLSADGQVLYAQRTISLTAYDSSTKKELWKFAPAEGVSAFAINKSNSQLAVGGPLGTVWILDAVSGAALKEVGSHEDGIDALAFSENGDLLVSGDDYGLLKAWRLPEGEKAYEIEDLGLGLSDMEIIIVGDRMVIADQVFDLETGDLVFAEGRILATFADAGLVATDLGSFIALQKLEDGEQIGSYDIRLPEEESSEEGNVTVMSAAISADHTKLAVGFSGEPHALVFDIASEQRLQDLSIPQIEETIPEDACGGGFTFFERYELAFSADGSELTASTSSNTTTWDLNTEELLGSATPSRDPALDLPPAGANDDPVLFSPNGAWIASGENLWNVETGVARSFLRETIIGFSADDQYLFTAPFAGGTVRRYGMSDFQLQQEISTGSNGSDICYTYQQAVSPDGNLYFEIGDRGNPFVWDLINGVEVHNEWIDSLYADQLSFSANDLLAAEVQSGAAIYDLKTMQEVQAALEIDEQVEELAISTNGELLAVAGWEQAYVWDLTEPEPARLDLSLQGSGWCSDLSFMEEIAVSPDGGLVAADCSDTLAIWDAHTGKVIYACDFSMDGSIYDAIYDLAFSPDGHFLAIFMSDGTIQLWGIPTQYE